MLRLTLIFITLSLAAAAEWDAAVRYWGGETASLNVPQLVATSSLLRVRKAERALSSAHPVLGLSGDMKVAAQAELRTEPLDATAMRQLAMLANSRQQDAGREITTAAERITRRDLATQFMLLDAAARGGQSATALVHYDRALSLNPAAGEKLFPILAGAVVEPQIRVELARYAGQPWFAAFVNSALASKADPSALLDLLLRAKPRLSAEDKDGIASGLARQLISEGQFAAARDVIGQLSGNLAAAINDFSFSTQTTDPRLGSLGWTFANDDAVETTLGASGRLDLRIASEQSGAVAERVTLLAPGNYAMTQVLTYPADAPHARITWDAHCLDGPTKQSILHDEASTGQSSPVHRTEFSVPSDCSAQAWRLSAAAQTTQFASAARITDLILSKPGLPAKAGVSQTQKTNFD